jgi:ABC-type antimicrobial peptide transport system permease subunit
MDTTDIKSVVGKTVTVNLSVNDETNNLTYTKEFIISGVVNEIDLGMSNIYYNYNYVKDWLKNEIVDNESAYAIASQGYQIIVSNLSDNKKIADYINNPANGGAGASVIIESGGNGEEGFLATSMSVAFKTVFAQLITIAQVVISLFIIIALVVSSIMTAIVLYSSVVERKTEIGIIKAVGGRNKDVLRIFESEAILMGVFSGVLGIIVAYICKPIIEYLIVHYFNLNLPDIISIPISKVPIVNVTFPFATYISLITISALISAIAGRLPSKKATKMQVIDALRDE